MSTSQRPQSGARSTQRPQSGAPRKRGSKAKQPEPEVISLAPVVPKSKGPPPSGCKNPACVECMRPCRQQLCATHSVKRETRDVADACSCTCLRAVLLLRRCVKINAWSWQLEAENDRLREMVSNLLHQEATKQLTQTFDSRACTRQ